MDEIVIFLIIVNFILIVSELLHPRKKEQIVNGNLLILYKKNGKIKITLDLHDDIDKIKKQKIASFKILLPKEDELND